MYNFWKIILLLVLGLNSTITFSQSDYLAYYNLVNKAGQNWHEKDYEEALVHYQKAFELVSFVHAENYAKAARVAAKLKHFSLTAEYMSKAIRQGYPDSFLKQTSFKQFKKSSYFQTMQATIVTHQPAIGSIYRRKIDSLHFIDQNYLRGNKTVTGFELDTTLTYSDAQNFDCLKRLIAENGFPSEALIGFQGYRKAWVLLLHNVRLEENHDYQDRLLDALKSGYYLPEHYCWVIDQGQQVKNEALIYYHWDVAQDIDQLNPEEKASIDERRRAVGMPSIERIKVVKSSGKKKNILKW